eukprot:Awhi_evm1s14818
MLSTPIETFESFGYHNATQDLAAYTGYSVQEKSIWISFRGTMKFSITNWKTDMNQFLDPLDPRTL